MVPLILVNPHIEGLGFRVSEQTGNLLKRSSGGLTFPYSLVPPGKANYWGT